MENLTSIVIIGIIAAILLLAIIYLKNKHKQPTNYKVFFIIGITWIPLGISTENYTFSILGIIFVIVGAMNKDKWKENSIAWKNLSPQQKKIKLLMILTLIITLVVGIIFYKFR
jgi:hypothetical protein